MIMYLQNKIIIEDEKINKISEEIKNFNKFFKDVANSPIGKFSINQILETVEESLNYLEIFSPILKKWIQDYLENNRGSLWLYYGLEKGTYLTDYWKISETNLSKLRSTWPFLFNRDNPNYKGFIIDLVIAQSEVLRQRDRQSTSNPNYKPFHPDGCSSGCSCWMLDDMEQWYEEEQKEITESKNIFFNSKLQKEFYPLALQEIIELKEQWATWIPEKGTCKKYNSNITVEPGQTPIKIVISWIKEDFYYSLFSMFEWSDIFQNVWTQIDNIDDFIKCQREKLKKIIELL